MLTDRLSASSKVCRKVALSDSEVRDALDTRTLILEPFDDKSLNPAGYDLRADGTAVLQPPRPAVEARGIEPLTACLTRLLSLQAAPTPEPAVSIYNSNIKSS